MSNDSIEDLEKRLAQLKEQWPAHSVPAAMLEQLDELEERLERARRLAAERESDKKPRAK